MDILLPGLLADLESRCARLQELLSRLPDEPLIASHLLQSYQVLEQVRRDAAGLRTEPTLTDESLQSNYLGLFQRFNERAQVIEWRVLPFLVRFNGDDRFLTQIVGDLVAESGTPVLSPVVGGLSSEYYWTFADYSIIAVPVGESYSLLGLPDLAHELGHIVLERHRDTLIDDFEEVLERHAETERVRLRSEQRPPELVDQFISHFDQWADLWLLEFVSDMVGAFVAGPCYGLQHVRLCAGFGQSAFSPMLGEDAEHPADDARLIACETVLRLLGDGQSAALVSAWWADYLLVGGESKPPDFETAYPSALLEQLATRVIAGCSKLGMKSYLDAPKGGVVALLNEGWRRFREDPNSFPDFEASSLLRLRKGP